MSLPDDVDDPSIAKASGRTVLPKHICWSGDPVYDLDDPEQRRLVYMKVLAEGLDRDVRHIIDVAELAALWPTLVLPAAVRDVWVPWFRDRGWLPQPMLDSLQQRLGFIDNLLLSNAMPLAMTRVDERSPPNRLFDMGALQSGQVLSYNKMLGLRQDAGNTAILMGDLGLLSDGGLLTALSKHTERFVSERASAPALNVLTTALMSAASGYRLEGARADRAFWSRLVESAVGAHRVNTTLLATEVIYWRLGNHEVDFVLHKGPRVVGIGVKTDRSARAPSGLIEFEKRFCPVRTLLVGTGGPRLDGLLSLPADQWFETT